MGTAEKSTVFTLPPALCFDFLSDRTSSVLSVCHSGAFALKKDSPCHSGAFALRMGKLLWLIDAACAAAAREASSSAHSATFAFSISLSKVAFILAIFCSDDSFLFFADIAFFSSRA